MRAPPKLTWSCLASTAIALVSADTARASDYVIPAPVIRVGMGPTVHFYPTPRPIVHFGLDVTAGVTLFGEGFEDTPGYVVAGDLGYSMDTVGLHAFTLGGGIGYGSALIGARYQPRLIAGTNDGRGAIGMRNSVVGFFLLDSLTVEAGHQFFHDPDGMRHDVHVLFGMNPAAAVFVVIAFLGGAH